MSIHIKHPKSAMQLMSQYSDKDPYVEAKHAAETLKSGYFKQQDVDYIRWLLYCAIREMKK